MRLRFDAFAGRLIEERTWHASQGIEGRPDGGLDLTMHVGVSPEVERWILGWGEHVEVLEPSSLRESIARTTARVCATYARAAG